MSSDLPEIPDIVLPEHAPLGLEESYMLGYNVERLRKQARMDIASFAQIAGITRPTVYKVESGESNLKLSYIRKIADALGVTVIDLLTPPYEAVDAAYYRDSCVQRTRERKEKAFFGALRKTSV